MRKTEIITCCKKCPFHGWENGDKWAWWICFHPSSDRLILREDDLDKMDKDCPLRKESLTLIYKKG